MFLHDIISLDIILGKEIDIDVGALTCHCSSYFQVLFPKQKDQEKILKDLTLFN